MVSNVEAPHAGVPECDMRLHGRGENSSEEKAKEENVQGDHLAGDAGLLREDQECSLLYSPCTIQHNAIEGSQRCKNRILRTYCVTASWTIMMR